MYTIHGLSISSNTTKTLYVAEALGIKYNYVALDVTKGEHKTPEHLKRHPLGKLPTLTHDDKTLFESNIICSYLADIENSELYPTDKYQRALVDQWLSFFTNHLGKWLNTYFFEQIGKKKFGLGDPNQATTEEAKKYIAEQLPSIDNQLSKTGYLVGESESIADYVAFAYIENAIIAEIPITDFSSLGAWFKRISESDTIRIAHQKLGRV